MRKIIAITHVTLDGIMQAPGGPEEDSSGGFTHGGWASSFSDDDVGEALNELMAGTFDLLLGRRTYEIFAAYWPYAEAGNSIAKAFNKATKYVATRTLDRFDWANSQRVGSVNDVRGLKSTEGPELHIWGSSALLQTLIAAGVVDEFRLWVYPLLLAKGKRLFENGLPPRGLTLVQSRHTTAGIVMNTYVPAGPLPTRYPDLEEPSPAEMRRRVSLAAEEARR